MALDFNVTQFNKINALVQQINTDLAKRPVAATTVTRNIAWVMSNVAFNPNQGKKAGIGKEIIFPVPFFGNKDKPRSGYEEIVHTAPEMVNLKCVVSEWAPDGEMIARGTQVADLYGIFLEQLPMIVEMGQNTIETHTADLLGFGQSATVSTVEGIGGGLTDYDGLAHFATNKLINPNRSALGTFSNYDGALKLDRAGLTQVLDFLEATPGPDGQITTLPGKNIVVVSNEDQLDRAAALLHGTQRVGGTVISVAGAPVGVGGTEHNSLIGRADLVKLPALRNYDGGKGWYAFRVSGNHAGVIVAMVQPPTAYVTGLSENDESAVTRHVVKYGRKGFWGHGYGWPQLSYKAIEP